ncbi:MAG: hypothetical protein P8M70_00785, partial [Verrucomicrobiota bacterium]|nr:hypothetical protein [Verrucomicrobiota bacterium]
GHAHDPDGPCHAAIGLRDLKGVPKAAKEFFSRRVGRARLWAVAQFHEPRVVVGLFEVQVFGHQGQQAEQYHYPHSGEDGNDEHNPAGTHLNRAPFA